MRVVFFLQTPKGLGSRRNFHHSSGSSNRHTNSIDAAASDSKEALVEQVKKRTRAIKRHAWAKRWTEALGVLRKMIYENLPLDRFAFNAVITALSKVGRWSQALDLAAEMREMASVDQNGQANNPELLPDSFTHSSVISALARGKQWQRAIGYFDEFVTKPDAGVYNALIHALGRSRKWQRSLALLKDMRESEVSPDTYTYSSLINVCVGSKRHQTAKQMYLQMKSEGVVPNVVTLTTMVSLYSGSGQWQQALQTYRDLILSDASRERKQADEALLGAVVNALTRAGQLEKAEALIDNDGTETTGKSNANVAVYNALMRGYAKTGAWEKALDTLRKMADKDVKPDTTTYVEVINSCALSKPSNAHLASAAYECVEPAYQSRVGDKSSTDGLKNLPLMPPIESPDKSDATAAANALIRVYSVNSPPLADEALAVLTSLRDSNSRATANIYSYALTMKALSMAGRLEEALAVYDWAEAREQADIPADTGVSFELGPIVRTAAVQIAARLGQIERAEEVFEGIQSPDVNALQTMVYVYERSQKWQNALDLLSRHSQAFSDGLTAVKPTPSTFHSAIRSCAQQGAWESALAIVRELMPQAQVSWTSTTFESLAQILQPRQNQEQEGRIEISSEEHQSFTDIKELHPPIDWLRGEAKTIGLDLTQSQLGRMAAESSMSKISDIFRSVLETVKPKSGKVQDFGV